MKKADVVGEWARQLESAFTWWVALGVLPKRQNLARLVDYLDPGAATLCEEAFLFAAAAHSCCIEEVDDEASDSLGGAVLTIGDRFAADAAEDGPSALCEIEVTAAERVVWRALPIGPIHAAQLRVGPMGEVALLALHVPGNPPYLEVLARPQGCSIRFIPSLDEPMDVLLHALARR